MHHTSRTRVAGPGTLMAALALGIGVAAMTPTAGADTLEGFRTPSSNIHCMFNDGTMDSPPAGASLRCDIFEIEGAVPPAPRDCDGVWGRSFYVDATSPRGQIACISDSLYNDQNPVVDYGETWQRGGFTCVSEQTGLTCFNARRHGFKLSKASRTVF